MRKITVSLDDRDLVAIETEAREKRLSTEMVIAMKLKDSLQNVHPADVTGDTLEARRAKRLAILQGDGPLWTGEPGKPKDGLLYEQELRAEW